MKVICDTAMAIDIADAPSSGRERMSIGTFAGFDDDGRFQVELPDGGGPLVALAAIPLTTDDRGANVLVAFVDDVAGTPVIVGRLYQRTAPAAAGLVVDGERMVIRAEREIELRCGDASIVLTRAGKILIRGEYVLTRSRGANKIKGAFVEIN